MIEGSRGSDRFCGVSSDCIDQVTSAISAINPCRSISCTDHYCNLDERYPVIDLRRNLHVPTTQRHMTFSIGPSVT
jgi:hypothetical protein